MDADAILTAISAVGFPIVAYGAMFWYMVNMSKEHKEEINALKDALNSNTLALTELKNVVNMVSGGYIKNE